MSREFNNQTYQIVFPPGASGHFLKNFLNAEFPNIEISSWAQDVKLVECSYIKCSHKKILYIPYSIGIIPANNDDLIKITINRFLKSSRIYQTSEFNLTSNKFLDKIFIAIAQSLNDSDFAYKHDIFSDDFDLCVYYNQVFDIDYLKILYDKINGTEASISKIEFAKRYIDYHRDFYQTPYYIALHSILKFEYENQLFNKTRKWSIDDVNLNDSDTINNWLTSSLKLENYY